MRPPVAPADVPLERSARGEDLLDVLGKLGVVELVSDIGERASAVARNQAEDARHRRGEAADDELAIEKDGRNVGALVQVLKVGIGAVELVDLDRQLVVDGLQL